MFLRDLTSRKVSPEKLREVFYFYLWFFMPWRGNQNVGTRMCTFRAFIPGKKEEQDTFFFGSYLNSQVPVDQRVQAGLTKISLLCFLVSYSSPSIHDDVRKECKKGTIYEAARIFLKF